MHRQHTIRRTIFTKAVTQLVAFSALVFFWAVLPVAAQQHTLKLYEGAAPGSEVWPHAEMVLDRGGSKIVLNVRTPEMRVSLPPSETATGAAIVLLPGGALRILSMGGGTDDIVAFYTEKGIAVIEVKYRTLQIDPAVAAGGMRAIFGASAGAPTMQLDIQHANANPAPNDEALNEVLRLAVADTQAAMGIIRENAAAWHIDLARVGMLGISAGGGVAMGALLGGDPATAPNFFISVYGPSLQDVVVPNDAPPLYLAVEANHGPVTAGITALHSLWKSAGKASELHVYEVPNFAMPVSLWGPRSVDWLDEQNLLAAPTE